MQPLDFPFQGAPIYRMSPCCLPSSHCVSGAGALLSGHLPPVPSSHLPLSCLCLLPTIHLSLLPPSPCQPTAWRLYSWPWQCRGATSWQEAFVPVPSLFLSACGGYVRTTADGCSKGQWSFLHLAPPAMEVLTST